ncbi:hypothetical protein D3C71_411280 [compost metagenome]
MLLDSIASFTPTAPDTSMRAPSRTRLRSFASTTTWPPVASVSEPAWNSTVPPLATSTRDRSRRSLPASTMLPVPSWTAGAMSPARWLSSAVAPPVSSTMAVVLPSPNRTWPVAPVAFRCTVPRVLTEVLERTTPPCTTSRPASVTSPVVAWISPVLRTVPAGLFVSSVTATSLPRVVEPRLPSVPTPLRMVKWSPAASSVCPPGVAISPALCTSAPSSST